jgi:DNA-binding YbaB/EbfC family protein
MINPVEILRMQSEAKKMQNKMREKKVKGESKDGKVVVFMNGAQEFEDIYIDDMYLDPNMADALRSCMKEAFKDFQKKLQKDMAQDLDIDQIKKMFGNK